MNKSEAKQLLRSTLSEDAYWMVNKQISKVVGIDGAILLADLISKEKYFESKNQLDNNGGFFNVSEDLQNDLSSGRKKIRSSQKLLIKNKFLVIKKRGVPAKNYFYIQHDNILKFLSESPKGITGEAQNGASSDIPEGATINNNKRITTKNNKDMSAKPTSITNKVKEIFDKGNKELNGDSLSWFGHEKEYGKNIGLIIKSAGNDLEKIRAKATGLLSLCKTDVWYKKQGFTPSALLSAWNKIHVAKKPAPAKPEPELTAEEMDRILEHTGLKGK